MVPEAASRSTTVRNAASSPKGTTNWYCRKPRRPYNRFHEPTASSGWKYPGMDMICPTRRLGAFRNQNSLNAATDRWLRTPGGGTSGGTATTWRGS